MNDFDMEPTVIPVRTKRRIRHMWLERGANHKWGWAQVGWGIIALTVGLMALLYIEGIATTPWGYFGANLAFWTALLIAVVLGFRVSVPRRFFAFRATDILFGISLGLALRLIADGLQWSSQGYLSWPSLADANGQLPTGWWLDAIVSNVLMAPVVEELFFRAFLLVAIYTVFRRITGTPSAAGFAAMLVTASAFMLAHLVASSFLLSTTAAVTLVLVGLVTAALVLITGRFWSALILHITFNGLWVAIALVGTAAGSAGSVPGLS